MAEEVSKVRPFNTYEVLECTDTTEWSALTADQKEIFQLLISAGTLDLGADTLALSLLTSLFPVGTTTNANLVKLIA